MTKSATRIQDKDTMRKLSVVQSTEDPTKYGVVILNPDGSKIRGPKGEAATVTVGTTTTGLPGTNASVTNTGDEHDAVLNFTIPAGVKGDSGTVSVGTTTTGEPGTNASVTNSGTSTDAVLNFTIPRGNTGAQGPSGTIAVGTTTTGNPGTNASVTNSGTSTAATFNFTIPRGDKGATGETGNGIESVTSSKSGKVTTVTMDFTDPNMQDFSFTVSDGNDGEGAGDVLGPNSSTDGDVVLFDGTTGKLIKDSGKAFTPAGIGALASSTKYGASLSLSVDTTTYVVTAQLKDQDGNNLGSAATIDLPLESVVVSGSYDSATKKVILTLQNGNTIEFSIADLVSGLQSEITSSNKLDADLVDDSTSTNKFVTSSDKTTWSGKQDALIAGTNITIAADGKTISATDTTYSAASSSTLGLVKLGSDTAQSVAANAVSGTASRTYAIQNDSNGKMVVNVPWENTTYSRQTPTSGGTTLSLVNTGDMYTWNNKQDALSSQTAYTSKGTASKVPQITTNSLGQVTGITEVNITYPSQVDDTAYAASWDGVTTTAPSKNAVYDKIDAMDTTIGGKQDKATSGSTAPSSTPTYIGQVYVDTTNSKMYVAVGTSSSSDWFEVGSGSGVQISSQANNVFANGAKVRGGTQANYEALGTYSDDTWYMTY